MEPTTYLRPSYEVMIHIGRVQERRRRRNRLLIILAGFIAFIGVLTLLVTR